MQGVLQRLHSRKDTASEPAAAAKRGRLKQMKHYQSKAQQVGRGVRDEGELPVYGAQ